ncbi:signal peptidase II [Candidatus Margulisiibacteriota bacterium]
MNIFYITLLSTLIADLLTKYLTVKLLLPFQSFSLIGNFLKFTYVQNQGAAFGIFPGRQTFLIAVSIAVIAFIIWFMQNEKPRDVFWLSGLGLLLGGTLGNLYNRIFQRYVIDFIDFSFWPTFNIADIAINVGVALIIYQIIFKAEKPRKNKKRKAKKKYNRKK